MSTASSFAYDQLLNGITTGKYPPGSKLGEEELSASLGVSRTPIREALRRLAAEGIVQSLPNRGARVPNWTEADRQEILELRAILEGYAARLAATRIVESQLDRLSDLADLMESIAGDHRHDDALRVTQLNNEFHRVILESSGHAQLISAAQGVVYLALVHRTFLGYSESEVQRSFAQHRWLIAALSRGDSLLAEATMRSHILAARHATIAGESDTDSQ
jgi:DNA-binding GntR family transcriptional regulator